MPPRKSEDTQGQTDTAARDRGDEDGREAQGVLPDDIARRVDEVFAQREREMEAKFAAREAALMAREREREFEARDRAADVTERRERLSIDAYSPPAQMDVPSSDEYAYRWVAEYVNGTRTSANIQRRIREGYERVHAAELPDGFIVDEDEFGDGFARHSGLILMRIPFSAKQKRDEYYRRRSVDAARGADELQGVRGLPTVREDRGSRVLTGRDAQSALTYMSQS